MKYISSTHSCYHFKVKSWQTLEGSRESSAVKNAMGFYGKAFWGWWAYWQEKLSAISVQVFWCLHSSCKKIHVHLKAFFQDQKAIDIKLAESYVVATESIQAQNVSFDQLFVQRAGMVSACGTCLFERLLVKYSTRDAIPCVFSYFKAGTLVEMCKLGPVSNTFMWLQFAPGTQQAGQWPHSFTYLWILQCCTWS